jgi:putative ABC transport system ATP-binding protein
VEEHLLAAIAEAGLADVVQEVALDFDIGAGAKRLTLGQQQKQGLARAILKAPDYLVANRCLSALDLDTQRAIIKAMLARARDPARPFGTFWVVSYDGHAELFDRLVRFERGEIAEDVRLAREEPAVLSSQVARA